MPRLTGKLFLACAAIALVAGLWLASVVLRRQPDQGSAAGSGKAATHATPGLQLLSRPDPVLLRDSLGARPSFAVRPLGAAFSSACASVKVIQNSRPGPAATLLRLESLEHGTLASLDLTGGHHLSLRGSEGSDPVDSVKLRAPLRSAELCREPSGQLEAFINARGGAQDLFVQGSSFPGIAFVQVGDPVARPNLPDYRDLVVDDHPGLADHRPLLMDLKISGTGVESRPVFSPRIFRYAVYPTGRTKSLALTASTADAGDKISVNGVPAAQGEPVTLDVTSTDSTSARSFVIDVTDQRGNSAQYEIVYLPVGFPVINTLVLDPARVAPGYIYLTLFLNPKGNAPCGDTCYIAILDNFGVPIAVSQEVLHPTDFKLQPDGSRSFQAVDLADTGLPDVDVVLVDRRLHEIERFRAPGLSITDAHDFLVQPDGTRIFLSRGAPRPAELQGSDSGPVMVSDGIFEAASPSGKVLFRWSSEGHVKVADSQRTLPDYFHLNSISVLPSGNYLISARGTSQVLDIDANSGRVIWQLGGVSSDFRFVNDPLGMPCGQHNATRLPNGDVLIFDNGHASQASPSESGFACPPAALAAGHGGVTRAAEYRLDKKAGTARLVWSYSQEGVFAPAGGSAQRLPNGDTLIGWARNSRGLLATEVDPHGNKVLEVSATYREGGAALSYRVLRFPE